MEGRLLRRGMSLALAMLVGGWIVLPGGAYAQKKVNFQLDWVPYGKYVGYYSALERGLYKAAGLDVKMERGFGNPSPAVRCTPRAPFRPTSHHPLFP